MLFAQNYFHSREEKMISHDLLIIYISYHKSLTIIYFNIYQLIFIPIIKMKSLSLESHRPKSSTLNRFSQYSKTINILTSKKQRLETDSRNRSRNNSSKISSLERSTNIGRQKSQESKFQNSIIGFAMSLLQTSPSKKNNNFIVQQFDGMKIQRRDRLKKAKNPFVIINYYLKNKGFLPSSEQVYILDRIIQFKNYFNDIKSFNLSLVLQQIFKMLHIAVDLNQTKYFLLTIMMAAEICFQAQELNSAFFFYYQASIAATCTQCWQIKIQALIYLGRICTQALQYTKSIVFFKKALQYAWKIQDSETELRIYDLIGQSYSNEGKVKQSLYYHNRYILGQNAKPYSAVKRTSFQLLKQCEQQVDYSQKQNLTLLFLGYLRLPISNFSVYPSFSSNKIYPNYINNESPRKYLSSSNISWGQFPEVESQIESVLKQQQFRTQIPNPDLYTNYVVANKYGKAKKQIQFEQSNEYHKAIGIKRNLVYKSNLKHPMDQNIKKVLEQKPNKHWWDDILVKSQKQRSQKMSNIRNKVRRTHLSFEKFPDQKKKIQEQRFQRICQSVNKIILNYIDPPKI